MDEKDWTEKIGNLPFSDESDKFFIKPVSSMSKEYAKTIIDKHIHFEWKHKEEGVDDIIKESMSGKVLSCQNNELKIYTRYEFMLEEDLNDPNDLKDNDFIKNIPFGEITNIIEFNDYRKEFWEMLPEDYSGNTYEITNINNRKLTTLIYDFDGINIYFYFRYQDKGIIVTERKSYPLYLLKEIKKV